MSVLSGCHAARNMVTIEESACPQCGSPIEFFMRDGVQIADTICDTCGFSTECVVDEKELRKANSI